jgi:hypothetical protein
MVIVGVASFMTAIIAQVAGTKASGRSIALGGRLITNLSTVLGTLAGLAGLVGLAMIPIGFFSIWPLFYARGE